MEWQQELVHHPSLNPSCSESRRSRETSTYSSPISASGSQGGISPVGLGISRCELDNHFSQLRVFPPTPTLPSQLIPEVPNPTFASYNDYACGPCYPTIYNGLPNSVPEASLGFYGPTTMSTTPSYNSSLEVGPVQTAFPRQMADLWIPTPCSGPTTPSDFGSVSTMNGTTGQWGQNMFPDACMPGIPLLPTNDVSYAGTMREMGYDSPSGQRGINTGQVVAQPRSTASEETVERTKKSSRKKRCSSADKFVSASGLECPICGAEFTRRSNCKEHQKLHNPEWKNNYRCDDCPKTFGRSSDLKRHRNTVGAALEMSLEHLLMETLGPLRAPKIQLRVLRPAIQSSG